MSPGASHDIRRRQDGALWPSVIAILFATLSMISFAVDQSVTLSLPLVPPAGEEAR